MNPKKLFTATLVGGIVANLYDFVVQGLLLKGTYTSMPDVIRQDSPLAWLVVGDFVLVLVVAWFYDRVRGSFRGGLAGGATFGFYVGMLFGFPLQLFMSLMFTGIPYGLAWIWVFAAIGWGIAVGATIGAVYGQEAAAV